jgi:excisionase family DNA binding protein
MPDEWLTIKQIQEEMHVSDKTVKRWITQGKLTAYKPSRAYLVKRSDLNAFLETHKVQTHKDTDAR